MDVLVVGAGPAGLTTACALSQQGVRVRVLDRADGPAITSRANILHARGVEVLDRLGIRDLDHDSLTPTGMTMYAAGRPLATMRFAPDERESTQAQFISQAVIEDHLRQRLSELGVEVEWGTEVTEILPGPESVTVRLASGQSITGSWVVGCDGSRSVVREQSGIAFPGEAVVEQFLLADVVARWDRERVTSAGFFHRDGMLLAIPMRGVGSDADTWRLMADVPGVDGEDRLSPEQIIERLLEALALRAGDRDVEIKEVIWTSVFRIQRRLADTYRRGRVLIAGDAAHIHSPIGGQGMNTGIGDAENLAWKLAMVIQERAQPSLLDTYTAERRPVAEDVLRNTTANTVILVAENPLVRLFRDRVFVPLLNSSAVQRQATRTASQLQISYRAGPLGASRFRRGLQAGDRVPDRQGTRTDGSATRVHAELGRGWVLLVSEPADIEVVRDRAASLDRWLGSVEVLWTSAAGRSRGMAQLIRPDGHLAWSGPIDSSEVTTAVARIVG